MTVSVYFTNVYIGAYTQHIHMLLEGKIISSVLNEELLWSHLGECQNLPRVSF